MLTLDELEALLCDGRPGLQRSIEAALLRPDRNLDVLMVLSPVEQVEDPDPSRFPDLMADPRAIRWAGGSAPEHFRGVDGGYSFSKCWDRRIRLSYDTPANAELMRLLEQLLRLSRQVAGDPSLEPAQAERAHRLRRRVEGFRSRAFDAGLRPSSRRGEGGAVLEQDPRYRAIRRGLVRLRRARLAAGRDPSPKRSPQQRSKP